uniref:Glycosyl transferase 48 domain-containing protein n=1 Tax=Lactuca sativa TaxID=4236 RepID=A0A9R1UXJ3_LACSA|nr:hypothetical protein LSAT_V11C700376540 [Lactuca sativa]
MKSKIGVFTAVPMVMGFILELGLLKAILGFITMQLQLCSVFFTFSLGTRTHYFGRTILHGGSKYRATGRGFVVQHIKFADNYRLYSRSHFVKLLVVTLLRIVYIGYEYTKGDSVSYVLLTLSSCFLVVSWLFVSYIFNPSSFEWQKVVEYFNDWTNWLMYKGGVGVGNPGEMKNNQRAFYKLHLTRNNTSLSDQRLSISLRYYLVLVMKDKVHIQSVVELTNGSSEDTKEQSDSDSPDNNPQYKTVYVGNLVPEARPLNPKIYLYETSLEQLRAESCNKLKVDGIVPLLMLLETKCVIFLIISCKLVL